MRPLCSPRRADGRIAVRFLSRCLLQSSSPAFRPVITKKKEQDWQDKERLDVLGILRKELAPAVSLYRWYGKIHRILRAVARIRTSRRMCASLRLLTSLRPSPRVDFLDLFDILLPVTCHRGL